MAGAGKRFHPPTKRPRKNNQPFYFPPKETCTRDFCLLAKTSESQVPSFNRLNDLQLAGLGKKKVTFESKKTDHIGVRNKLELVFPKLKSQGGAFELLKAARGGKSCPLTVIPLSSKGYTIEYIKEFSGSGTLIYVRPMQSNLSMAPIPLDVDGTVSSECQHCHKSILVNEIRTHIAQCSEVVELSRIDEDDELFADDGEELISHVNSMISIHQPSLSIPVVPSTSSASHDIGGEFETLGNPPASSSAESQASASASTSQQDNWKYQLQSLFPDATRQQIEVCLAGAKSLEEAANRLVDVSTTFADNEPFNHSKISQETSSLPGDMVPNTLGMFLNRFIANTKKPGFEEVTVSRDSLWVDALRYYKRKISDPAGMAKNLEITFKEEEGLDGGAMKNEFFQLLMAEAQVKLFEGDEKRLVPIKDSTKLFLFRILGMMIVHIIIQDGPLYSIPPLAPSVLDSLVGESKETTSTSLSKDDVPLNAATEPLHDLVKELDLAETDADIKKLLFESEDKDVYWVLIGSCHWPIAESINIRNKNMLIQDLIYNEIVSSRREEIGEISKGLEALGFLEHAKKYPTFKKQILCYNEDLRREFTVEDLRENADVTPVTASQQQALDWLYEYLSIPHPNQELPAGTRMKTLLQFWCGSKHPPRGGFTKKLTIRFLAENSSNKLPTSTACLHILRLPTLYKSKEEFCIAMTTALKFEAHGFPNP